MQDAVSITNVELVEVLEAIPDFPAHRRRRFAAHAASRRKEWGLSWDLLKSTIDRPLVRRMTRTIVLHEGHSETPGGGGRAPPRGTRNRGSGREL